jgi:DNA-binding MarR family transcriptional regulator
MTDDLLLQSHPEPDPFTPDELTAWRGLLRVHTAVTRELDRRLTEAHGLSLDTYAILITLITAPGATLTMGELARRRNLTAAGISRAVDRAAEAGLLERVPNPADRRSFLLALTADGVARLREAQVTHHATVRELLFGGLGPADLRRLGGLWEKAMPGASTSPEWPLPESGR